MISLTEISDNVKKKIVIPNFSKEELEFLESLIEIAENECNSDSFGSPEEHYNACYGYNITHQKFVSLLSRIKERLTILKFKA